MKSVIKKIIILILCTAPILFSQDLRFRHLSVENGLSQNTVNCLYQDRYGFIWIGTEDGLNRYDGYQFDIYKHDPADSASLSHSWIWDIKEDKNGNLWIATWHGLNRYDRAKKRFIHYLYSNENNDGSVNSMRPATLCVDSSGTLWVGTWGHGIKFYQADKDTFITPGNIRLPSNYVRRVYTDHAGILWVGTWNGLVSIRPKRENSVITALYQKDKNNKDGISSNRIFSIYEDKENKLWIGTFNSGLNLFLSKTNSFIHYRAESKNTDALSSNQISFIFEDNKNRFWIGTVAGGLNLLDKKSGKIRHFRNQVDNPTTLSNDRIFCILQDRSGMLWIGGVGLNMLSDKLNRFAIYRHNIHNPNSLSHNEVWAFCEDNRGDIWIGLEGGELNRFNIKTNRFHIVNNSVNDNGLRGNDIRSLLYHNGKIWIGTNGHGLNIYNFKQKSFTSIRESPAIPQTRGLDDILALAFDHNENLWIGTYENGLIVYDYKHNRFKKYISDLRNDNSLSGNYIRTVFCDSRGTLWIGGWGGGLCRFNEKTDDFTRFVHERNNPKSIISNIVHCINETNYAGKNILWVGTNSGLSYMNLDSISQGFRHVNVKGVLNNHIIYGIQDDNHGNLWLSSNQGLYRYNPENKTVKHFTYRDGLQSNEFNANCCFKCENGMLLFGGVNGFNAFLPENIRESLYKPPIVLTSFKISDKEWRSKIPLLNLKSVKLNHKQNFISFDFSALDFNDPLTNRYKYKMEGFDQDWIESGTRHYASYTNLDPGRYTFKIAGSNSDGKWSDRQISLHIIITPPYWATWWFRLLAVFAVFALFYIFHKIRVARLLEIERLRVQIASDLHDDIGSALTKIAINSEIIQNTKNRGQISSAARSIGQVSRAVITTMSDIIWSIDARNDTVGNLIDRMKDIAVDMLSAHDIQYDFKHSGLDPDRKIAIQLRQNLFLIFKEAVNNIVRHSQADDVIVELLNSDGLFIMKIKDNGKGFNPQSAAAGNGIKNIKMRAERIGAQLEIVNNDGTTILLTMKSF